MKGVGLGMSKRKIVLVALLSALLIGIGIIVFLQLIDDSDDFLAVVRIDVDVPLNDEQNQLLTESILPGVLTEMNDIQDLNSWLMLEIMRQVDFVEGRTQGQSGVGLATLILYLLELGEFKEIAAVRVIPSHISPKSDLILRAVNIEGGVYYISYNRTWGLSSVTRGAVSVLEGGEIVFIRGITHNFDFDGNFIQIQRD